MDGHEVRKEPEKVREKIGFLTGDIKLDPQFSPDYMFDFFGKIHGVKPERLKERKEELFTYFGIKDFAHKKMKELSTGMGQKAAIAVSLVHDPDIVIFDEPTNGLDVVTARSVTDYLKRLKEEGKLVIISTHIMSEAEKLCDRIGVIIDGRKVMEGHLEDILRETQTEDLEDAFFELYSQVKGGGKMREIRLICKKELSRVLTDRKMLFSIFLLPAIIMVVVMNVMTSFSENLENDVKSHAPIVYLQSAPEGVEQYLKAYNEKMDLRTMDDEQKVTEEIRDGSADLWIAFPQDFLEQIEVYKTGDEIPQIKVYYNPSEEYSQAAYEGVAGGCLEVYRQALLSERVGDMQSLTVFTVNSDNPDMVIQDEQKAGGKALGMMLPYFVTILLFAGAMGLGTDMVAGEKERGTMASMLVAPIKRSSIVLGKVFALMIISGISSVVYVAVMVGFLPQMMGAYGSEGLGLSLEVGQVLMMAFLLIAIAFLYSGIIVLISVFAKDTKEASSYIMPVYMLILILGIATMFTTQNIENWYYAVPVFNTALALQGILTGDVSVMQYAVTLAETLILGMILITVIAKAFESEKVMAK